MPARQETKNEHADGAKPTSNVAGNMDPETPLVDTSLPFAGLDECSSSGLDQGDYSPRLFEPRYDLSLRSRQLALLNLAFSSLICMIFWSAPVFELAIINLNPDLDWPLLMVMMSFGFCFGCVVPGLLPELWTYRVYLYHHLAEIAGCLLSVFGIGGQIPSVFAYVGFVIIGWGFVGMYITLINLSLPLFPTKPGATLAFIYGVFSVGIIASPQIGKRYVEHFSAEWAWAIHLITYNSMALPGHFLIYRWNRALSNHVKEELGRADTGLSNGMKEAGGNFIHKLKDRTFWAIGTVSFAYGWCMAPVSIIQTTMQTYFGSSASQSADTYTIMSLMSPIPRIGSSLMIDCFRTSWAPYGGKNVTTAILLLGLVFFYIMRYAWESKTIYTIGMMFIMFAWNSYPPMCAAMAKEAYGARSKEAFGLIMVFFTPGSLVAVETEQAVGIEKFYHWMAGVWVATAVILFFGATMASADDEAPTEKSPNFVQAEGPPKVKHEADATDTELAALKITGETAETPGEAD